MKKLILISFLIQILNISLNAQIFHITSTDNSKYPQITNTFYTFDNNGKKVNNLSNSDFKVTNGNNNETILSINCSAPSKPINISSVLTIDVSGSMKGNNLTIAKSAISSWVKYSDITQNECGVTSFNDHSFINQDFTTDPNDILNSLVTLTPNGGTDYNQGFFAKTSGGLSILKNGINSKKILIFLTDGFGGGNENQIISTAKSINATVYCVGLGFTIPQILKNISIGTNGLWFENINSISEIEKVYRIILANALQEETCSITWLSDSTCNNIDAVSILYKPFNITENINLKIPNSFIEDLSVFPDVLKLSNVLPNTILDTNFTVQAKGADITINSLDLTEGSNIFSITSATPIKISKNTSQKINVRFQPKDSNFYYANFKLNTNIACIKKTFGISGGFNNVALKSLKVIFPNGNEKLIAGKDTNIIWNGVGLGDTVNISYSTNAGKNWNEIFDSGLNQKFKWNATKPISDSCLLKLEHKNPTFIYKLNTNIDKNSGGQANLIQTLTPDSTRIVQYDGFGVIEVWDYNLGKLVNYWHIKDIVNSLIVSNDGSQVITSDINGIKFWDINNGKFIKEIIPPLGLGSKIQMSSNGNKILIYTYNTIVIYDIQNNKFNLKSLGNINAFYWNMSHNSKYIFTADYSSNLKIWKYNESNDQLTIDTTILLSDGFDRFAINNSSTMAAWTIQNSNDIKLWDIVNKKQLTSLDGTERHYCLTFSSDDSLVFSGGSFIRKWNINLGSTIQNEICKNQNAYQDFATSLIYTKDNKLIWNDHSWFGGLMVVDFRVTNQFSDGKILKGLSRKYFGNGSVAFSKDGNHLAYPNTGIMTFKYKGLSGFYIRTSMNLNNNKNLVVNIVNDSCHKDAILSMIYSNSNKYLISGSADNTIKIWNVLDTYKINTDYYDTTLVRTIYGHNKAVKSIQISSDDKLIYSASDDSTIKIWNFQDGKLLNTLLGHKGEVNSIVITPDNSKLISCSTDSTIIIWDLSNNKQLLNFKAHNNEVSNLALVPNSNNFITVSKDSTYKIWDINTGKLIYKSYTQGRSLSSVAISPESKYIFIGTSDGDLPFNNGDGIFVREFKSKNLIAKINDPYTMKNVRTFTLNPSGSLLFEYSYHLNYNIYNITNKVFQTDTSDALWSIISPKAAIIDTVNFGSIYLNNRKDTIINKFIENVGQIDIQIDSIQVIGQNSSDFSIVSGTGPFKLSVGEKRNFEISFKPSSIGNKTAILNVFTQAETLISNLNGNSLNPQIQILNTDIDFGKIKLGTKKDTVKVPILFNKGNTILHLKGLKHNLPNNVDFTSENILSSTELNPNDTLKLNLHFNATFIGKTNGELNITFSELEEPINIQLFGEGFYYGVKAGKLVILADSGKPEEIVPIKIKLSSKIPGFDILKIKEMNCEVVYNTTIMEPFDFIDNQIKVDDNTYKIPYKINLSTLKADSTFDYLNMKIGLGNSVYSNIRLQNCIGKVDTIDYYFESRNGLFTLLGMCEEGGTRLFNPNGKAKLTAFYSSNMIIVQMDLIEKEYAKLSLFNILGEKSKEINLDNINPGHYEYKINTNDFGDGIYNLILETPTIRKNIKFLLVK